MMRPLASSRSRKPRSVVPRLNGRHFKQTARAGGSVGPCGCPALALISGLISRPARHVSPEARVRARASRFGHAHAPDLIQKTFLARIDAAVIGIKSVALMPTVFGRACRGFGRSWQPDLRSGYTTAMTADSAGFPTVR